MPSALSLADIRNDLRFLGAIDRRHAFLEDVPDRWFQNKDYVLLSERADDGTPLVAVALEYPSPCPIEPSADVRIAYWVANLNRREDLLPAFVKSIVAINAEMARLGARRVWGAVPKSADHLTSFLDRVAEAGKCERVDGAGIPTAEALDDASDYGNFYFYIGDREAVTGFMKKER